MYLLFIPSKCHPLIFPLDDVKAKKTITETRGAHGAHGADCFAALHSGAMVLIDEAV